MKTENERKQAIIEELKAEIEQLNAEVDGANDQIAELINKYEETKQAAKAPPRRVLT